MLCWEKSSTFCAQSIDIDPVTALSLLSGCDGKSAEKEEEETITVYLWTTNLYEKYAPYIQEQLPDINVEFVVGNNNLDFYSISVEIKETEDG